MPLVVCPGLPASWLNGWLAAVGATVLEPRLRLHWTTEGTPVAVLSTISTDPVAGLLESWPDRELLTELPIAEQWRNGGQLRRKVRVGDFVQRARAARHHPHSWTLSSTMTDLAVDGNDEVAHAPFDPAGPGTTKWLHHRLVKVHGKVMAGGKVKLSAERLGDSLKGLAARVRDNGLGFDQTRLGSQSDKNDNWVDPVVEVLVFFGLAVLPFRGDGITRQGRQRGWRQTTGSVRRSFMWPAWHQPLDRNGIDALLDLWRPERKAEWRRVGVHGAWRSVQHERRGDADNTRAFGSERL